jgi:dienelactone hydrolase
MSEPKLQKTWIDHIPTLLVEPDPATAKRKLVLWIPYFTGRKEDMEGHLRTLAGRGYHALSYDPWQHGARAVENPQGLQARVFGNFRRYMWPIIGQTALDALRILDWAAATWDLAPEVAVGGISMGGDVAVAVAGLDPRVQCAAAIASTPDWTRPGMDAAPGEADAYARHFYESLDPLTHLDHYRHTPAIDFECGAEDLHVPPDGAARFREPAREIYGEHPDRLRVTLHPGVGHTATDAMWKNCLDWLDAH